eukprot:1442917-Rhodomonas_salina.1
MVWCYAVCGDELAYGATRYALPICGTELAYGGHREVSQAIKGLTNEQLIQPYLALPTPIPSTHPGTLSYLALYLALPSTTYRYRAPSPALNEQLIQVPSPTSVPSPTYHYLAIYLALIQVPSPTYHPTLHYRARPSPT